MEATLETIRQVTYECIDYIEENAVWLGIVGMAVLILMLLLGGLAAAGRSRKQTRALRRIDKKMEKLLAAQEESAGVRAGLAEDVAAMRAASEVAAAASAPTYAQTVESFFADTQVETCEMAAEESLAEPDETAVAPEEAEAPAPAEETEAPAPAEEMPAEVQEDVAAEPETVAAEPEEALAFHALQETLLNGAAARGKSGRLYTREELENQIRK